MQRSGGQLPEGAALHRNPGHAAGEDVSIARSLPDGIIIQVRESVISFAVMTDTNACWLIGPGGKALERIEPAAFNENPHINGLLISSPTAGDSVSSPTPTALAAALDVMKELDPISQFTL